MYNIYAVDHTGARGSTAECSLEQRKLPAEGQDRDNLFNKEVVDHDERDGVLYDSHNANK